MDLIYHLATKGQTASFWTWSLISKSVATRQTASFSWRWPLTSTWLPQNRPFSSRKCFFHFKLHGFPLQVCCVSFHIGYDKTRCLILAQCFPTRVGSVRFQWVAKKQTVWFLNMGSHFKLAVSYFKLHGFSIHVFPAERIFVLTKMFVFDVKIALWSLKNVLLFQWFTGISLIHSIVQPLEPPGIPWKWILGNKGWPEFSPDLFICICICIQIHIIFKIQNPSFYKHVHFKRMHNMFKEE